MRLQWQAIFKQKGFENRTSAWVPWDPEVMKLTSRSLMFLKVRRMTVVFVGFFPSARLWCMPCDVCAAIPLLKCYFKIFFFFKNLPVRCPQAKIPEQLSLPPLLPAVLSFHPLPSVFIFCWKKENHVPSKLPNIHFEIYPLTPSPPELIPNPHISLFHVFPPDPFPSRPCVAVGPLLSLLRLILLWVVNVETCRILACCLVINLFSPSLGPDLDLSMWLEKKPVKTPLAYKLSHCWKTHLPLFLCFLWQPLIFVLYI